MVDVTVLGISLRRGGASPVLLLHPTGTRRILSVDIAPLEAVAVSAALHGPMPEGRAAAPETQEFALNAVAALGAELVAVELVGFSEGEFAARAVFARGGAHVRVACRPADGAALALRSGAVMRCAEALLEQAESIDTVMAALPEHVRALAAAKLGEQGGRNVPEWLRVPLAVEEALAARARNGAMSAHEELVSVARKMFEEEAAQRGETPGELSGNLPGDRPGPRISIESGAGPARTGQEKTTLRAPQIRVTMVRHTGKGKAEIINEFHVSSRGIPGEVLASLGLSSRELAEVNDASENERWATLLRMLAPPTKVHM